MENNTDIKEMIAKAEQLIKSSKKGLEAEAELNRCIEFALNEWKTNQRWFREEPGHVTTADVIKHCVEYGWAARHAYDYRKENEERWKQEKEEK